jgi:uncharacterized membrane protein YdbT with pleckstrin-like domain
LRGWRGIGGILVPLIIAFSLVATVYGIFSNKIVFENRTFQTMAGENVALYGKGLYYKDSVSVASQAKAQGSWEQW